MSLVWVLFVILVLGVAASFCYHHRYGPLPFDSVVWKSEGRGASSIRGLMIHDVLRMLESGTIHSGETTIRFLGPPPDIGASEDLNLLPTWTYQSYQMGLIGSPMYLAIRFEGRGHISSFGYYGQ